MSRTMRAAVRHLWICEAAWGLVLPAHMESGRSQAAPLRSRGGRASGARALGRSASSSLSTSHINMTS